MSLLQFSLVVTAGSALLAWPCCRLQPAVLRRFVALWCVPFLLSYCIYWLPAGDGSSEKSAWDLVAIMPPVLAGAIASVPVVLVLGRRRANRDGSAK